MMEAIWQADWRLVPAVLLVMLGLIQTLLGVRRQAIGMLLPVRDPAKALTWLRGFRQTIVGLALLGVGTAWLFGAAWLLAISLIIGGGELFESSLDIWGLTKAKDLRISITIRR
ncbi:MAG: hypothetical protein E6J42_07640 [Chloroflexi bacterium]|nr:MAG: hypothetical protein E6J42_07640 [Chloroflexota bacterium]